jgi:hypothetical protein
MFGKLKYSNQNSPEDGLKKLYKNEYSTLRLMKVTINQNILYFFILEDIKNDLKNARVYMEGRGVQIEVNDHTSVPDIKKLVEIKLKY